MADLAGYFLVDLNTMLEEGSSRTCMFPPLSETDFLQLAEGAAASRGEALNTSGRVRCRSSYCAANRRPAGASASSGPCEEFDVRAVEHRHTLDIRWQLDVS